MNWVDLAAIGVVVISAILAFMRGFVREVLGIFAWAAAAYIAVTFDDAVRPQFRQWISSTDIADPVSYVALFVVALLVFSLFTSLIAKGVRSIGLSGIDRSLGVLYGAARGAVLLMVAYIIGGLLTAPDKWPEPVQTARLLPSIYDGAAWIVDHLPPEHRPKLALPPAGPGTSSADLLRANPIGRATGKPTPPAPSTTP
jgi:membrane protein required for colicin V production